MNKTIDALKLAEEALNAMLTHMGMDEDEWTKPTFNQAREALAAILEALAEQSKCACDSPAWCTKYKKCNREMLGLPKAEPVKQQPVAWLIPGSITGDKKLAEANGDYATPLYAAPVDAKAIRAEALEQAAKVADRHSTCLNDTPNVIAAAIRGLK